MAEYWLSTWLDEQGIGSPRELAKALRSETAWHAAVDLASAAANDSAAESKFQPEAPTIVAGRQIDLPGIAACEAERCLERELDEGLAPALQYFDRVVVEGLAPRQFFQSFRHLAPLGTMLR